MKKNLLLFLTLMMTFSVFAQNDLPAVYPYAENGKWGVINKEGKIILKPKYKEISLFRNAAGKKALATVTNEDGLIGSINRKGKLAAKIKYSYVDVNGKGDLVIVKSPEGLFGLVSTKNKKELLPTEYNSINRFRGQKMGLSIIQKGDKYGCINEEGTIIAQPIYKSARILNGYSDFPDLKLVDENDQNKVMDCWGGPVKKNSGSRAMDDEVVFEDMTIEEADEVPKGPEVSSKKVTIDGQPGFVITTTYTNYQRKKTVVKDTILGIDKIEKIYKRYFSQRGHAVEMVIAKKDGKTGIVSGKNEILTPFEYDSITEKGGRSYFIIKKGDKMGLATNKGKKLLDAIYDKIKIKDRAPTYTVVKGNFEGYADRKGHVYLPARAFSK